MILNLCSGFLTFDLLLCPHVPFSFQTVDVRLVYYRGGVGRAVLGTQEHFKLVFRCSSLPKGGISTSSCPSHLGGSSIAMYCSNFEPIHAMQFFINYLFLSTLMTLKDFLYLHTSLLIFHRI